LNHLGSAFRLAAMPVHDDSSMISSRVIATEMVLQGSRRKPSRAQSMDQFFSSVSHLHLASQRIMGDLEPLKICPNLSSLYIYDNQLTTLRGLANLRKLTHLYAQDNELSSLDDFKASPSLEQLFLNGNRIRRVRGLENCQNLRELHLGSQRLEGGKTAASLADSDVENVESNTAEESGAEGDAESIGPQLSFDQSSLWAIAPTLQLLDLSACGITDSGIESLVVLQSLRTFDVSKNRLTAIERLQQLLLRLPALSSLKVAGNPLVSASKWRERIVLAAKHISELDGKEITANERAFLSRLASVKYARQQGLPLPGAAPKAAPQTSAPARAPGTISNVPSYPIRHKGLAGEQAPGMRPGSGNNGAGGAMPGGRRTGVATRDARDMISW